MNDKQNHTHQDRPKNYHSLDLYSQLKNYHSYHEPKLVSQLISSRKLDKTADSSSRPKTVANANTEKQD